MFRPSDTIPLKPGDFMRHPKGGPHYDGALDEDVWVAIGGYGPTKATVIDGGALFGRFSLADLSGLPGIGALGKRAALVGGR